MKKMILSSLLFVGVVAMLLVGCGKAGSGQQGVADDGKSTMTETIPDVKDVKDIPWGEYEDGSTFDPFADTADSAVSGGIDELLNEAESVLADDIQEGNETEGME